MLKHSYCCQAASGCGEQPLIHWLHALHAKARTIICLALSKVSHPMVDRPLCCATGSDAQAAPILPNKKQKREPSEPKPPKPQPEQTTSHQASPDLGPPPEPTDYVKNRPRRETGRTAMALGHTSESLELVKCCEFVGPPGSGAPLAQPFRVEVSAQVSMAWSLLLSSWRMFRFSQTVICVSCCTGMNACHV